MESDEAFGSFMNPNLKAGKSPIRSVPAGPPANQFHAAQAGIPMQQMRDPRVPFGSSNRDAVSPARLAPGAVQGAYSPRDPRLPQYNPYAFPAVAPAPFQPVVPQYITHPIQYSQLSPEYQPHQYVYGGIQPAALPPPPYVSPRRQHASRSQPASRRRRSSLSSMSSDSDAAEEISARIMAASSDDPRELRSIIKSTRGSNRSLRKHNTDVSPRIQVDREPFPRDRSVPSMLDEFSDVFRTDGSPYDSIYKSHRRKPSRKEPQRRRQRSRQQEPRPQSRRSRTVSMDEDHEIPAAVDAETWFNPEQSPERDESPSIPPPPTKRTSRRSSSSSTRRNRRRRSVSEQPPRRRPPRELTTNVAQVTAIVPVDSHVPKQRKLGGGSKRSTQKDMVGERVQRWWNPASIVTGKRQRLPVLDWRKGERYNRAPDGTIIGVEGFDKLVFDDTFGNKKGKKKQNFTRMSEEPTTAASEDEKRAETKRRKRRSSEARAPAVVEQVEEIPPRLEVPESMLPSADPVPETVAQRPLLSGWDYMHKNDDGVFCLDKFQIIHRLDDRKWSQENPEGGFIMSPSINCDSGFVAEMCLIQGMPTAPIETLGPDQALFVQVLRGAPNSVRVQVNGSEERLSPDDIMFIDCGSSYSITNVSREHRAVLSFAFVQNKD